MNDIKVIQNATDASLDLLNKKIQAAYKNILKSKCFTGDEIEPWGRISTGCQQLDHILLGGIPINGISEIYGCSGVGKTQFALQLAMHIQLPNQLGGKRKEVVYISTEDVFPSRRLNQLADAYRNKYNVKINFEDHIYVAHIADSTQLQKCLLNYLPHFVTIKNIGLIVIDSIAGLFRSENDNPNYVTRSQEFKSISRALNQLQDQCYCGILTVNQVSDNISSGISEPSLGLSWSNNINSRFCISRNGVSPIRSFKVVFVPDLPPTSSSIIITSKGLLDA